MGCLNGTGFAETKTRRQTTLEPPSGTVNPQLPQGHHDGGTETP